MVGYDFLATFYELAGGQRPDALTEDVDGVSLLKLFANPNATSPGRRDDAVFFHRSGRRFSAIRQGDYKLMVFWRANGKIARHELYHVGKNPTEESRDIASEQKAKAESMQETLLAFLKSVSAESPSDFPPKRRNPQRRKTAKTAEANSK